MPRSAAQLRHDVERIWRAGVAAVAPERLVAEHVQVENDLLVIDDHAIDLRTVNRIAIVGAGKAAGALAVAIEDALGPRLLAEKNVTGWVNVPADCVLPSSRIVIHPARPATVNEPRSEGVEGTRRILEIVLSLGPSDLCICVLTGGGSALLPAPVPEVSLAEKIELTRLLSAAGANIEQLNMVRRQISLVKGGGLARASSAGQLVTLIISDVLGDSLESIASGPTVINTSSTPSDALAVLESFQLLNEPAIQSIVKFLKQRAAKSPHRPVRSHVTNFILANNATAVDAAGIEAERLGYSHAMISATRPEGPAEDVARHLAGIAVRMRSDDGPDCLISGGEPTVTLVDSAKRGRGGRNQQLALTALIELGDCDGITMLAAGTDGEDGPTDAAGAFVTTDVASAAAAQNLNARDYLERNDAYSFFEKAGGLFITGPTHTNVCDLRVIVVHRMSAVR
jgi:glycerate 2-kinase